MGTSQNKKDLYIKMQKFEENKRENEKHGDFDLHVHSLGSSDGKYTLERLVENGEKMGLKYLSVTDHNNLAYTTNFLRRHLLPVNIPYHEINSLRFVPGVEVTCRIYDSNGINHKGNPAKIHVLVYGPNMANSEPFVRLMKAKHTNDIAFDFGTFIKMAYYNDIELNEKDVRRFIEAKRDQVNGFSSMDAQSVWEYFNKYHTGVFKSRKEVFDTYGHIPHAKRLNLDAKEVIDFAHEAGALCVLAHPQINMDRMNKPEKAIDVLLDYGMDGFEMDCPTMRKEGYYIIKKTCDRHSCKNPIIFTSGSDYHRQVKWRNLGWYRELPSNKIKNLYSSDCKTFTKEIEKLKEAREYGLTSHRKYQKVPRILLEDSLKKKEEFVRNNKYWKGNFPILDSIIKNGIEEFEDEIKINE